MQLDQRMPHVELKLKKQQLHGLAAPRVSEGLVPSVGGIDAEQIMRDIRTWTNQE